MLDKMITRCVTRLRICFDADEFTCRAYEVVYVSPMISTFSQKFNTSTTGLCSNQSSIDVGIIKLDRVAHFLCDAMCIE